MAESVPVRCPECQRTQAYAAPVFPCACGSPVAPPVTAGATAEPITHRNWTDEWVTVRCGACGREDDWPHPELGCACGTVLRVPVRPVQPMGAEPDAGGGAGGDAGGMAAHGRREPGAPGGTGAGDARPDTLRRAEAPRPAEWSGPLPGPAPRPPLTPPSPDGPGPTAPNAGAAGGSGPSGTSGTHPGTDPRRPGLIPPTATGGTFGARPAGAPLRPGTSGLSGAPGAEAPGGPARPRAFGPGSEWFGPGPAAPDGSTPGGPDGPIPGSTDGRIPGDPDVRTPGGRAPGGRDVPPRARAHRTFAERYPTHIPLPPTAPRPAPARDAFRPVTIRTARDAVAAAAGYLRWLGFRDVVQPEDRPASGVDLRAPGLVAQVDPSTRPAGLRAVECLWLNGLSTPDASVSVFFSLAGYTPEARERAAEIGLPLFVLDLTGTPQPANHAADELAADGA
ncbi:hypothetical protein ACFWVF_18045 [Streptomyces sp. NPDC058659]|uniref:hypothetical protein n=1 Tax=unclassified Streptomyces TaxID=2593676 RepID=UPI0036507F79